MQILTAGSRIDHPAHGKGVVINVAREQYFVSFIDKGVETIPINDNFTVIEAMEYELDLVSFYDIESSLRQILERYSDVGPTIQIADKWKKGTLIFKPGDANMAVKEVPIDSFFHKIVMVRDRLRVMEQKINSSALDDATKVDLQQYITRIYGSLTTFNVLFRNKEDHFSGSKSN